MKECEALKSLEEILSLDVVDNQFVWSSPIVAANTSLPAQAAATAPTTTFIGHGFCEISGSPDSCYYSDRSRAASGDEPLSPVTPLSDDLRRLPSIDEAMTAVQNARSNQDRKILTDLTSNGDLFDPSICDLLLDSSANEKDVFESGDWTYLEAVPPFQTSMKPEEELSNVPDLLVNHRDVIRSYWPEQGHVIVQVPPSHQWPSEVDLQHPNAPSYVLIEDSRSRQLHQSYASAPIPVQIERRESLSPPMFYHPHQQQHHQQQQQHHQTLSPSTFESSVSMPKPEVPKRQGRRQKEEVENRLCHVCGEKAGKHSYYGGQVCPSCRAFFRRSVQSKYSDSYKCSKDGQCEIRLKTRKNCQYCRFKLCEQAGMRRSWVLADGERKRLTGGQKSPNNKTFENVPTTNCPLPTMETSLLLMDKEESDQIQDYLDKMTMIRNQTEDMNPEAMDEIALMLKECGKQTSKECREALKQVLEQRTRLFALNVTEFTSLNSHDQIMLLEENKGPLIALRVATFFHTEVNWRQQIGMILGQSDVTRLTESLSGLQLADDRQLMYEQFFVTRGSNPGNGDSRAKQVDDELQAQREHKRLLKKISSWVEDETSFCLMNLIILFCTDQTANLNARGRCEALQTHFSNLLFKYFLSRYGRPEALAKFSEGIRTVSYCRELNKLAAKAKLCCKEPSDDESGYC